MVRITPISPGTMLYWVIDSGLYRRWICTSNGGGDAFSDASGPTRSLRATEATSWVTAEIAAPVAVGSAASASISTAGRSPRSSRRVKSAGIVTTNWTFPRARASRPLSSSGSSAMISKYSVVLSAATNERVNSLWSAVMIAVGMCLGSVLIA